MDRKIYFDCCKSSPVHPEVIKTMETFMTGKPWIPGPFTSSGVEAASFLEEVQRNVIKALDGEDNAQIIFTSGGTEANNLAIRGVLVGGDSSKKHFVVIKIDHPSILAVHDELEREGHEVTYLPVDSEGFIDLVALKNSLKPTTVLVSLVHANHMVGTIQPLEDIVKIVKENSKALVFVDACESFTKIPFSVIKTKVDLVSISGHKIHGPQGVGALYVRKGIKLKPLMYGSTTYSELRPGAPNIPGIAGLNKAIELSMTNFEENYQKIKNLSERLIKGIEEKIPYVYLNGARGEKRNPYNINLTFRYVEGESILMFLDMEGIVASSTSSCLSKKLEPDYVLLGLGKSMEEANSAVRFTLSAFNTQEEVDQLLSVLPNIISTLRERSPLKPPKEG